MKYLVTILLFISLVSCKGENTERDILNSLRTSHIRANGGFTDGVYPARVGYYYPKTGTRSTYTLKVKVKDNRLRVIYWPNGGWLDDSHFTPPDIHTGITKFKSDRGVWYTVDITGE
ncbi:hypothetical protein [Sinomicrobium sp. M5D2P9]